MAGFQFVLYGVKVVVIPVNSEFLNPPNLTHTFLKRNGCVFVKTENKEVKIVRS